MEFRADISSTKLGNVSQTQHAIKNETNSSSVGISGQVYINDLSSNSSSLSNHVATKIDKYKQSDTSLNNSDLSKPIPIRFTRSRPNISPRQDILSLVKDSKEIRAINIEDGVVKIATGNSGNAYIDNKGKFFTSSSNAHLLDAENLTLEFDDSIPVDQRESIREQLQNATVFILSDSQFSQLQQFIISRALNETTTDSRKEDVNLLQKSSIDGKTPTQTAAKIIEL